MSLRQAFAPTLRDSQGRRNYWKTQRKSPVTGGFTLNSGVFRDVRSEQQLLMGGRVPMKWCVETQKASRTVQPATVSVFFFSWPTPQFWLLLISLIVVVGSPRKKGPKKISPVLPVKLDVSGVFKTHSSRSSILIGFSIINHPIRGTPIFGNTHINPAIWRYSNKFRWSRGPSGE